MGVFWRGRSLGGQMSGHRAMRGGWSSCIHLPCQPPPLPGMIQPLTSGPGVIAEQRVVDGDSSCVSRRPHYISSGGDVRKPRLSATCSSFIRAETSGPQSHRPSTSRSPRQNTTLNDWSPVHSVGSGARELRCEVPRVQWTTRPSSLCL